MKDITDCLNDNELILIIARALYSLEPKSDKEAAKALTKVEATFGGSAKFLKYLKDKNII